MKLLTKRGIVKTIKFIFAFILMLAIGLGLSISDFQEPERDYTGFTEHNIPDIAIDFEKEYIKNPVVVEKWKLSMKRLTKEE